MLQDYIDLLKHAMEVMGNLGHSGAGFPEYVNAVGYEFLILGLGVLYLAFIAGIVAIPIIFIKRIICGGRFSSAKWKKYMEVRNKMNAFYSEYTGKIRDVFSEISWREDILIEKLLELYKFLKEVGCEVGTESPNFEEIAKDLRDGGCEAFSRMLPSISAYKEDFKLLHFYDSVMNHDNFRNALHVKDDLTAIFQTEMDFRREYRKCVFRLCVICGLSLLVYLVFLIPFILVFF